MLSDDSFRRPQGAAKLLDALQTAQLPPVRLMEVCGTHTMAIARSGLKQLLPPNIKLISGPGCPVCVTPAGAMDEILRLSSLDHITITTYGDLLRVPGSQPGDSLQRRRALGADIRVVYSPMDALDIAQGEPDRQVVFLGVGFETTAPGTALAVLEAQSRNLSNFSMLCLLKRTPPALRALIAQEDFHIDGFLCPGHVATILGSEAFRFLPEEYGLPAVVAGFEAGDLLAALVRLVRQVEARAPALENEYTRAVASHGNQAALAVMERVLEPCPDVWRGLGAIPDSGFRLRGAYFDYDAAQRFGFCPENREETAGCRCGDVICGRLEPGQCPLFGSACQPEHPVGPCMVSTEGACAAAYHYGRAL